MTVNNFNNEGEKSRIKVFESTYDFSPEEAEATAFLGVPIEPEVQEVIDTTIKDISESRPNVISEDLAKKSIHPSSEKKPSEKSIFDVIEFYGDAIELAAKQGGPAMGLVFEAIDNGQQLN